MTYLQARITNTQCWHQTQGFTHAHARQTFYHLKNPPGPHSHLPPHFEYTSHKPTALQLILHSAVREAFPNKPGRSRPSLELLLSFQSSEYSTPALHGACKSFTRCGPASPSHTELHHTPDPPPASGSLHMQALQDGKCSLPHPLLI